MGLSNMRDSSGSSPLVNLVNLVLRVIQFILALAVIAIYASEHSKIRGSQYLFIRSKFIFAIAAGTLSVFTDLAFAVVPFVLSYHYVAIAFVWDWMLFFIWTALYVTMRNSFPWGKNWSDAVKKHGETADYPDFIKLQDAVWVDLAAMLMWLITAIMGPVMLIVRRKGLRFSRGVV